MKKARGGFPSGLATHFSNVRLWYLNRVTYTSEILFRRRRKSRGSGRSVRLRVRGIRAICRPRACSLRLAAQDVALSRRKQGFESPRERHLGYQRNNLQRLEAGTT